MKSVDGQMSMPSQLLGDVKSGIYSRFDWYTAIWYNTTLAEIFEFYEMNCQYDPFIYVDDMKSQFFGGLPTLNLEIEDGLRLFITKFFVDMLNCKTFEDMMNVSIPSVRVDFSGRGLALMDYERMVRVCRKPLPDHAHITRIDLAYDLIDYKPESIIQFHDFLIDKQNLSPTERICVHGKGGGYEQKMDWGSDVRTIMIGAPKSDKMLKFYDKKLQNTKRGVFVPPEHYKQFEHVNSWLRLEWRLRDKDAHQVLYAQLEEGSDDSVFFQGALKNIYEHYQFRDMSGRSKFPVADFWRELIDWLNLPQIIQNLTFVKCVDELGKIITKAERSVVDFMVFISQFGIVEWNKLVESFGRQMNDEKNEIGSKRRRKLFRSLSNANGGSLQKFRESGLIIDNFLQYNKFIIDKMAF